jgi:hypothetical protein
MLNLSSFLDKYKNVGMKEVLIKESLVKSIKKHTGGEVGIRDVLLRDGVARLKISPLLKSVIFTKKESLLSDVFKETKSSIKDIL